MSELYYRYFGGLLTAQQKWLNHMAEQGKRLVRTGKMTYEFEHCSPGQVQYCVEFVAHRSAEEAEKYGAFLEEMGYRVFRKNLNLNYSVGKVRWRPWADRGGRVATAATTFDRELLIVEREHEETPFQLHTSYEDLIAYYTRLRGPWLFLFLFLGVLAAAEGSLMLGLMAAGVLIPTLIYQRQIGRLKAKAAIHE